MDTGICYSIATLTRDLARADSLMGAFRSTLAFLKAGLDLEVAAVALVDEEGGAVRLIAAEGVDEDILGRVRVPVGGGLLGRVQGEPSVRHVGPDEVCAQALPEEAALLAPGVVLSTLFSEGRGVGALALVGGEAARGSDDALASADLCAALCAWALQNVHLYEDLEQRIGQLTAVFELGKEIVSTLNADRVLTLALEQATRLLGCETCSLMLLDAARQHLTILKAVGLPEGVAEKVRIPMGVGIAGKVAKLAQPILMKDVEKEGAISKSRDHYRTRSCLSVPLVYRGDAIGVLNVNNKKDDALFTQGDLNLLTLLANQVAIAIENARLHSQVEQLAVTDGLTGLYNRTFFVGELRDEFERARRNEGMFSVVICDIDHFKRVNDRWGHAVGDRVLVAFARVLKSAVRDHDVVARYGGEEFIILLRGAPSRIARVVAERLRASTEACTVDVEGLRVTASFGVASLTERYTREEELVASADEQLYRAKESGRNRVCVAS